MPPLEIAAEIYSISFPVINGLLKGIFGCTHNLEVIVTTIHWIGESGFSADTCCFCANLRILLRNSSSVQVSRKDAKFCKDANRDLIQGPFYNTVLPLPKPSSPKILTDSKDAIKLIVPF